MSDEWRQVKTAGFTRKFTYRPHKCGCGDIVDGVAFQIDDDGPWVVPLDELRAMLHEADVLRGLAHDGTPQSEYEHCEKDGLRLLSRAIELAPTLGIDPQEVGRDETAQLRVAVEAMRPIVDLAFALKDAWPKQADWFDGAWNRLHAAIDTNRPRVTAALAGVAVDEEKERMRRLCEAACEWVDRSRKGEPSRRLRDVTAAVDAYRRGTR